MRASSYNSAIMPAPREQHSKLRSGLAVGAGVALAVLLLRATGLFELWELKTQDLRTHWTLGPERTLARPDVVLLNITDASIDTVRRENKMPFPWDWDFYALFLEAAARGKASSVLFDMVLLEDREGAEDLAASLAAAPPTYFPAAFWEEKTSFREEDRKDQDELLARFAVPVQNDGSVRIPERFKQVLLPAPSLAKGMAGFACISTPRDLDGLIRRYPLLAAYKGRIYPSFPLAALLAREKAKDVRIRDRAILVGNLSFPVEEDGSILLRYYPQGHAFAWREATHVLAKMTGKDAKGFDPSEFAGKTVVVGTSATALTDLRVTPVSKVMPGPEIHMVALANLLNGDALRSLPGWVSALWTAVVALATALAVRRLAVLAGAAAAAGVLAVALLGSVGLFRAGRVVEVVPPAAAGVLAYAAASAVNYLYEGRQRQRIKRDFQKYLSPRVVEKILKNPDALSLAGERKTLTIFFMDFAGFTSLSEKLEPAELVKLIDEYHNEAAEEIFATEGTLDKFIGDAIMAFWNDPIDQEDHAWRACRAAIGAQKRLVRMAEKMRERGLPEMSARIGLNTGVATVGNMGARNQVNYTLIGDEVNLASRLEGVNKEFGTDIIVSEATYLPVKDRVEVRELALIKVKGKKVPVRIYELMGIKGEVPAERVAAARAFEKALGAMRARNFAAAWEAFLSLSQQGDPTAGLYVEVCEQYRREPPPADWDGSYQMESK
jgi:adenylate cyclase